MGLMTFLARIILFVTSGALFICSGALVGGTIYLMVKGHVMETLNYLGVTTLTVSFYVTFGICILLFLIAAFGIFAVCCSSECSAKIYILLLCVVSLAMIASCIVMIVSKSKIEEDVTGKLAEMFVKYKGEIGFAEDRDSEVINFVLLAFEVCEYEENTGFPTTWVKNTDKTIGSLFGSAGFPPTLYAFPFVCCKGAAGTFNIVDLKTQTPTKIQADIDKMSFISNCYLNAEKNPKTIKEEVPAMIENVALLFILVTAGTFVCSLVLIACAVILLKCDGGIGDYSVN